MNELLTAALGYAARGWAVFPCYEPTDSACSCGDGGCKHVGKHPRTAHGRNDATTDEAQITAWWKQWPDANVAIATGNESGLAVLDVDSYAGADDELAVVEAKHGPAPATVTSLTGGGGKQFFFKMNGTPITSRNGVLAPHLDIKGIGGYVIAPPSLHRSGQRYAWDLAAHPEDQEMADAPSFLASGRPVNGTPASATKPTTDTFTRPKDAKRHDVIRSRTMRWANQGLTEREVRVLAFKVAEDWGLIAENRGNEVENLVRGAMLKVGPTKTDEPKVKEAQFMELQAVHANIQEPIPWQVEGYMSRGESVTIGGEWGSGKSLTALDLAIALATGTPWMDHVAVLGGPYRVIYLDEENGRPLAERRVRQLLKGRELSVEAVRNVPLFYTTRNGIKLSDPSWYDWLKGQIEEKEITHFFMDSLIRFSRIDENSNSENAAFFSDYVQPLMNEYNLSVLAIDHMGKPSKERTDPGHRLRGASEKPAATDELLCMDGERGQDTRTLTHEKTRWHDYQPPLLTTCTESADGEACWITAKDEKPEITELLAREIQRSGRQGVLREDLVKIVAATASKSAYRTVSRAIATLRKELAIKSATERRKVRLWASQHAPAAAK